MALRRAIRGSADKWEGYARHPTRSAIALTATFEVRILSPQPLASITPRLHSSLPPRVAGGPLCFHRRAMRPRRPPGGAVRSHLPLGAMNRAGQPFCGRRIWIAATTSSQAQTVATALTALEQAIGGNQRVTDFVVHAGQCETVAVSTQRAC